MKAHIRLRKINFAALTAAGIINSIGVSLFLVPVHLYDSGISGTSILFAELTNYHIPMSVFLILLNVPLFLYGLGRQGKVFTIYSLYAILIYSLSAYMIQEVLPIDVSVHSPIAGADLLLCAVFGGLISGIGSGMTIRYGAAIDGIEVLAVIFAKNVGITVGSFVMIYNTILYIFAGIATKSGILPLYSIITYAVGLKAVDFIVEGLDKSKSVMIITERGEEIADALIEEFGTGPTMISAIGGYTKGDRTVLYFVVNRFQIANMRNIVHDVDAHAYMTISEVTDVFKARSEKKI